MIWAAKARDSAGLPGAADVSAVALWGALATVPVLIVVTALIAASDKPGWRLPAWTSASAAVLLGAHALAFSGSDGALPGPAAAAAVVWGAAFAAATVRRGLAWVAVPTTAGTAAFSAGKYSSIAVDDEA